MKLFRWPQSHWNSSFLHISTSCGLSARKISRGKCLQTSTGCVQLLLMSKALLMFQWQQKQPKIRISMATIAEMARRFKAINLTEEAAGVMEQTAEEIADLNRRQLYQGLDRDGKPLSPKYTEDPYFKSVEAAIRYAKWKQQITPDPARPWDVPNLFIVGRFHGSIGVDVSGDKYQMNSSDPNASDIGAKFKTALGLNESSKKQYREQTLHPALRWRVAAKTGTRIG